MECIFCQIIAGKFSSNKLLETEKVLVIENINPEAPFHGLAIPKKHLELANLDEGEREILGEVILAAKRIGNKKCPGGYRLVVNIGEDSNREIDHLHMHILGGKNLGKMLE